jgi:TRAP-type C4-dicarboxylate transport system permease small subunit
MSMLKWLDANLEEFFMVLFLALMTMIMGVQIGARYVFNYSLSWSEEITRYLFVWSAFLSVSYCTKKCISIKIEQVTELMSKRGKALIKLINHTIEIIFFFYLIPYAAIYLKSSIESGQVSPACRIPMYFVQAAPLFSFIMVAIRIAQRWGVEFKMFRKG